MATIDELRQEPHWSYSALNTYLNICHIKDEKLKKDIKNIL